MTEQVADPWHLSVLLEETVSLWHSPGGTHYVDGTIGGGGHTRSLLDRDPKLQVLGIDRDPESLERTQQQLHAYGDRLKLQLGTYADLEQHLAAAGFPAKVDGILLDLGVNSHQLDAPERGFSFRWDGPLDMRFNADDATLPTAADLVNHSSEKELIQIFRDWGEEPRARRAAWAVVKWRQDRPFTPHPGAARLSPSSPRRRQTTRWQTQKEDRPCDALLSGLADRRQPGTRTVGALPETRSRLSQSRRSPGFDFVSLARRSPSETRPAQADPSLHLPTRLSGVRVW